MVEGGGGGGWGYKYFKLHGYQTVKWRGKQEALPKSVYHHTKITSIDFELCRCHAIDIQLKSKAMHGSMQL